MVLHPRWLSNGRTGDNRPSNRLFDKIRYPRTSSGMDSLSGQCGYGNPDAD
ncbi:MAG: hypothetical protein RLP44_18520 [Aggregatilineales bacterium]